MGAEKRWLLLLLSPSHPAPTPGRAWRKATDIIIELKAVSNQGGTGCRVGDPDTCLLGSHPSFQVGRNLDGVNVLTGRSQEDWHLDMRPVLGAQLR